MPSRVVEWGPLIDSTLAPEAFVASSTEMGSLAGSNTIQTDEREVLRKPFASRLLFTLWVALFAGCESSARVSGDVYLVMRSGDIRQGASVEVTLLQGGSELVAEREALCDSHRAVLEEFDQHATDRLFDVGLRDLSART